MRKYAATWNADEQITAEEDIACHLAQRVDTLTEGQCADLGRSILRIVLSRFRPDLMEPDQIQIEGRKMADIRKDLSAALGSLADEGVGVATWAWPENNATWPDGWRWIACYYVTGDSEGHYVHVDVVLADPAHTHRTAFLLKTFRGAEHAAKLAAECARLLGA